ncbi:MAG: nucleotidyltransferase family protein, partial [Oscillospiraceae bacterium]|nr:nucleotidyltransferase family protein [Oscillospiraceae bacterium]
MTATGVVCEYNPIHNGHAHHLEETRKRMGGAIICVMSGNFVQRGEPA